MIFEFDWLAQDGVQKVINLVYQVINIMRIVVPIGLIVMTTIDITKKVINPEDKEGQKKIMIRAIAALIVFLIPTIVNIALRIIGIDKVNMKTNTPIINPTLKPTLKPTMVPTIDPNKHINNLTFINCPSSKTIYHNNNTLILDTNIPNNYTGNIKWSVTRGNSYIKINEINSGRSIQVDILDVTFDTKSTVMVEADGIVSYCDINLEKEKLASISFTNCPDKKEKYLVGDKFNLNVDIPSSFNGEIKWDIDSPNALKSSVSVDKRSGEFEILDQPKMGYVIVSVVAGGTAKSCLVNVEAVKELKITNCPDASKVYKVGEKIILTSNLPSYFKRDIIWNTSTSLGYINIKPLGNGLSAEIEITAIPKEKYVIVGLGADSKGTSCTITVGN